MNKQLIYLSSLLVLAMTAAFAGSAQDINASGEDAAVNNSTLNDTAIDGGAMAAGNATVQDPISEKNNGSAINLSTDIAELQNLSSAGSKGAVVAPISQMAGVAPLVAAGASSIQVAGEEEGSYKIGTVVGDIDLQKDPAKAEPLSLGITTKPLRDTGKMFFVCDIV